MVSGQDFTMMNFIVMVIKSRKLRWEGHVAGIKEGETAFCILAGKTTGKRAPGNPRHRWKDNITVPGHISIITYTFYNT